jgi:hypothetical protein
MNVHESPVTRAHAGFHDYAGRPAYNAGGVVVLGFMIMSGEGMIL